MLQTLRRGLGFRVAMALAIFAAICFVMPPAPMAFGHGSDVAHCLSSADSPEHGMQGGAAHHEHGAMPQSNGDHTQLPSGKAPGCCGLFCLSALAPNCASALAGPDLPEMRSPRRETRISGRVPELLDRPPISLFSV